MKYQFVTNAIQLQLYHYQQLSRWLQQQELIDEHMTRWLMKIGLERCLLRLESSMHVLLRFLWHKEWHGVHVFHFLDILKSFDKCDTCINTYKFCLIAIVTPCLYYVYMLDYEHCISILWKFSLKIQV
jgi:hypothetical protein